MSRMAVLDTPDPASDSMGSVPPRQQHAQQERRRGGDANRRPGVVAHQAVGAAGTALHILKGKNLEQNITLMRGDVIIVP